jgi:pimeloyl-ACP methyl ester carboxylesterase
MPTLLKFRFSILLALSLASPCCQGVQPAPIQPPPAARPAVERVVHAEDGLTLSFAVYGEGSPTLVFVHGWSCDRTYWGDLPNQLGERYRVVALDLAGHGESGRARDTWNTPLLARDVAVILEELQIEEAILIGHSMGGDVILETAVLVPERVVALIGVDTYQQVEEKNAPEEIAPMIRAMEEDYSAATEQILRQYFFQPTTDPELIDRIVADMLEQPAEIAIPLFEQALLYDMAEALARIEVPVRAINSDLVATDLPMSRRYAADFDAVVISGVGHFPMLEAPGRFRQALEVTLCTLSRTPCQLQPPYGGSVRSGDAASSIP